MKFFSKIRLSTFSEKKLVRYHQSKRRKQLQRPSQFFLFDSKNICKRKFEICFTIEFFFKKLSIDFFRRNSTRSHRFIKQKIINHYRQLFYFIKKIFAISTSWRSVIGAQIDSHRTDQVFYQLRRSTFFINFVFLPSVILLHVCAVIFSI